MANEQQVLQYLQQHPDFLLKHGRTLGVKLSKDKVLSMAEVQLAAHQAKVQKMADHVGTLIEHAQANQATAQRLLQMNLRLLRANTVRQVVAALSLSLNEDFGLPAHALRLIEAPDTRKRLPENLVLNPKMAGFRAIEALKGIECTQKPLAEAVFSWLPEGLPVSESFLHLPLYLHPDQTKVGGVLLIGHPDPDYFHPELETRYVAYLAGAVAAALARVLGCR